MLETEHETSEDTTDVVPSTVVAAVGVLWLLLLGGRWVITPILLFLDPSISRSFAEQDRGTLLRLFLALVSMMLLIVALRFVRSMESSRKQAGKRANGANGS
jgi:hypothetical protein